VEISTATTVKAWTATELKLARIGRAYGRRLAQRVRAASRIAVHRQGGVEGTRCGGELARHESDRAEGGLLNRRLDLAGGVAAGEDRDGAVGVCGGDGDRNGAVDAAGGALGGDGAEAELDAGGVLVAADESLVVGDGPIFDEVAPGARVLVPRDGVVVGADEGSRIGAVVEIGGRLGEGGSGGQSQEKGGPDRSR
jgi:hypothetical protein